MYVDGKLQEEKNEFSTRSFSKTGFLNCSQVLHSQSFKRYHIFHDLNCKNKLLIYVMECRVCLIHYIEKSEMEFNIRLNNHQ